MKITDIHVDGFGVWRDLRLKKLSPEVTVFYGDNEAGKTTLMHFLRSVLYGVSPARRERYLPPLEGGKPGGRLGLVSEDGPFEALRYADRGDDDRGLVQVELPDGTRQGDRLLRDALEGVDEVTFTNVFAVGLDEIHELGALGGAEAAKSIYRLTSGLDRVSLYDLLVGLRESREKLLGPAGRPSVIGDLLSRRETLQTEISQLTEQNRRWGRLSIELDELAGQIEQTRDELKRAERAARRIEVALGIKPHWAERRGIEARIVEFDGLYRLPDSAIDDLDALNERIEEHRRQRDIFEGQRKQLLEESDELGVNDVLVRNCCRLDALSEQREWVVSLDRDAEQLQEEVDKLESRLASENRRLGKVWSHDPEHTPELTQEMVDELEPVAEELQDAERGAERAKAALDAKRGSELKYRTKIESAMTTGEKLGLPTDIKEAGDLVAQLRRRLQIEQRLEQSRRHALELEQQSHDMLDRQVMPMELFIGLCAGAVASAVLLGLFVIGLNYPESEYANWGPWAAALGIGGPLLMIFLKYFAEESAADQLDSTQRQMELTDKQITDAQRDMAKVDAELPMIEGSVVLMLQKAERHLADLEKMLPVESQRRQADGEAAAAESDYENAKQRLAEAMKRWQAGLRGLGLPDRITPADLTTLAAQYDQLTELRLKTANRQDEVDRRRREFAQVTERITSLAEEADLVIEDATAIEQLEALLSERRLQQGRIDQRKKQLERADKLLAQMEDEEKAAEHLVEQRQTLFRTAGVATEEAYRSLAADLAKLAGLRSKRERVTGEIAAAIGRLGTEEDFAPLLTTDAAARLDDEWEELTSEHERIDEELRELLARRGSLTEQQKTLAEDSSLADRRMDLDAVEQQLAEAGERWRERAAVGQMLEMIRSDYEANRQPDTLLEASKHLDRLTNGRYPRVWTPLANDVLYVDNRDGQSLPVETLSRGTREQLFLSVRMALVAMFARRGVQLPMILDDVLVNFDVGRSKRAAEVLTDFARAGHQLLVFTCHEHVWQLFKDLHCDVRRLPNRFGDEPAPVEVLEEVVAEEPVVEETIEEVIEEVAVAPESEPVVEEVVEEVFEPLEAEYVELEPQADWLEAEYTDLSPRDAAEELAPGEPAGAEVTRSALTEIEYATPTAEAASPPPSETEPMELEYRWATEPARTAGPSIETTRRDDPTVERLVEA